MKRGIIGECSFILVLHESTNIWCSV